MDLDPQSKFSLGGIEELVDSSVKLKIGQKALNRVKAARDLVDRLAGSDRPIYGINTGFGRLAQIRISFEELKDMQYNYLRSHASGIGNALPERVVRRLLLLRLIGLSKGYSGVSPEMIERHLIYLNRGLTPFVPEQGSVGASGDLAPLAHLALTFIGEGYFMDSQRRLSAKKVLGQQKLKALDLKAKDGLSLTNGTQFSLALAMEAWREFRNLLPWLEAAIGLSLEAHQATDQVFLSKLHRLKPHAEQQKIAARIYARSRGSKHMKSHRECDYVQDAYSFRCIPHVLGASYQMLKNAEDMLMAEVNSVSDNPLVFVEDEKIYSCGHFHAQYVGAAADIMTIAAINIGNIGERRIDQLVNPLHGRSPAFLANHPGVESGLMILHTACAAIASENKTLGFPASADTISTNGNQEDHVSMAPWAARKAIQVISNLRKLVAAEIITGVRGCVIESTRTGLHFSRSVESFLGYLSKNHPRLFKGGDRKFGEDWERLDRWIAEHRIPEDLV